MSYRGHTQLIAGQKTRKDGLPPEALQRRQVYRDEARQKLSTLGHVKELHSNILKLQKIEVEVSKVANPSKEYISKQVTRIQALRESSNIMFRLMGKYLPNLAPEPVVLDEGHAPEALAAMFFRALQEMQAADTGDPVLDDEEEVEEC